jgi:hypothetical protein
MGQKSSKSKHTPSIQLILNDHKHNIFSLPESFQDFESIAYNFYYSTFTPITAYEYLTFTYTPRRLLKSIQTITDKASFNSMIKCLGSEQLQIELHLEQ